MKKQPQHYKSWEEAKISYESFGATNHMEYKKICKFLRKGKDEQRENDRS